MHDWWMIEWKLNIVENGKILQPWKMEEKAHLPRYIMQSTSSKKLRIYHHQNMVECSLPETIE